MTAAIAMAIAVAAIGCSEPGEPYACSCTWLTDYDDTSRHEVLVCAPSPDRALSVARGCAQSGAPAPVQGCACRPAPRERIGSVAGECRTGECAHVTGASSAK